MITKCQNKFSHTGIQLDSNLQPICLLYWWNLELFSGFLEKYNFMHFERWNAFQNAQDFVIFFPEKKII